MSGAILGEGRASEEPLEAGLLPPVPSGGASPPLLNRAARLGLQVVLIAAGVAIIGYVVLTLRVVVIPVIVALFLATILYQPKERLRARGFPPALATLTVMVTALVVVAGLVSVLAPAVAEELGTLGQSVRQGIEQVGGSLAEGPLPLGITQADIDQAVARGVETLRENTGTITQGLLSGAIFIGELLVGLLLTLVLLFFFLKDGDRIWAWVVDLFPSGGTRADVEALGHRVWAALVGYIRGVAVVATIDSVFIGIGLAIVGVPLVLPLAVLTFFAAFLPLVGAFTAGLIAALVALVSDGVVTALVVVALITAVQQLEGHIIYPVVVARAIQLHPIAILLAVTSGAIVGGIVGALFAPPAAAVAWTVISYLRRREIVPDAMAATAATD
jgi:predicted PurR-regulated permease PerM